MTGLLPGSGLATVILIASSTNDITLNIFAAIFVAATNFLSRYFSAGRNKSGLAMSHLLLESIDAEADATPTSFSAPGSRSICKKTGKKYLYSFRFFV
ncbi:MAG: hypothetical protein E7H57_03150 [Pantoea sp.]|nr:hypothetical protein [Pantoea sp.]